MRTFRRHAGTTLMVIGALLIAYAGLVVFWRDPVTDVIAIYQQRSLSGELKDEEAEYVALARDEAAAVAADLAAAPEQPAPAADPAAEAEKAAEREAEKVVETAFRLSRSFARKNARRLGHPIGRLTIDRLGLSTIVVEGTDYWSSLSKGPGRYGDTGWPGSGATIGVAGHRTTFSAPFRHIDDLRKGDRIRIKMPYGTFEYRVRAHRIVDKGDWSIVKPVGHEQLVLSACHPLYSAEQRYVVFADLDAITLPGSGAATAV